MESLGLNKFWQIKYTSSALAMESLGLTKFWQIK